jgi:hypothetical protein
MAEQGENEAVQGGLSEREKLDNVIRLAFDGQEEKYKTFCQILEETVPPGTTVILRGSAVTGFRWRDEAPFDADGPGTSDLDVTMVGDGPVGFFTATGFYVPGVHSRPLCDEDPDVAPPLVPLRKRLMAMVNRPVNLQASRNLVIRFRGDLLDQPYLTMFTKPEGLGLSTPPPSE